MGKKITLYLASGSPRRHDLLKEYQIPFTLISNELEEEILDPNLSLRGALRKLAREKALASKKNYKGLILSADTIVVLNNLCLGKPKDKEEGIQFLQQLSGTTHQVLTGFCLLNTLTNTTISRTQTTSITFKPLTKDMIQNYVNHNLVTDKAGGYGIQDLDDPFVESIKGDYYNVIGLPILLLKKELSAYKLQ